MTYHRAAGFSSLEMGRCLTRLSVGLVICILLSGCTVNRVSVVTRPWAGGSFKADTVKFWSTFRDIGEPWRIEGMVSVYTLPIMNNTTEKRHVLLADTAAELGAHGVVGVQSLTGEGHAGLSNGILVRTGRAVQDVDRDRPKFLVFLPPVNFKIRDGLQTAKFDESLREHIQYFLSYTKGYYVHRWNSVDMDLGELLRIPVNPAILLEPLGVMPDYLLLCDVTGYDERGNVVTSRAVTLRIVLTLFDVQERKVVWSSGGAGAAQQSLLSGAIMFTPLFCWSDLLTESEERSVIVRRALLETIDSLPEVPGFRGGPISPVNRKE